MPTGQDLLKKGASHLNEKYVLGALAPKNNPAWKGPWDCAEFISWCVYQLVGELYGCNNNNGNPAKADAYTGYWQRDANGVCPTVSVEIAAQTPGAIVLRYPQPSLIGHIVFSDGKGGTLEAKNAASGVTRATLAGRRWDTALLIPGIEYTQSGTAVVVTPPLMTLRLTSPLTRGALVRDVQRALKAKGFDPGKIDGAYGLQTVAAVNAFQITAGLVPDGEVGAETAAALGVGFPG
jgi:N-acetylmuramoyl-L-alanine amidase